MFYEFSMELFFFGIFLFGSLGSSWLSWYNSVYSAKMAVSWKICGFTPNEHLYIGKKQLVDTRTGIRFVRS